MPRIFQGFIALQKHIKEIEAELGMSIASVVKSASYDILEAAREICGEYQLAEGGLDAWQELSEVTQEDREARGYPPNEPELREGTLRDSYHVITRGFYGGVGSDLPAALSQEQGDPTKNLPARPILGFAYLRAEKRGFANYLRAISKVVN